MADLATVFVMTVRAYEIDRDLPYDDEVGLRSQWTRDMPGGKLVSQAYCNCSLDELKAAPEQFFRLALDECVESSVVTARGAWIAESRPPV
jgi:hypothetical protein